MIDGEAVLSGVVADAKTIGRRIASGLAARPSSLA